jgi:predicted metal-binding membrane protein
VLRRDRIIAALALAVLAALAWSYLLWLAGDMSGIVPQLEHTWEVHRSSTSTYRTW